ncbi:MAG: hypothetical protein MMC23_005111 [Stictis urceolatum]|nr:hypothetical protein [Stictis urceolata]
MKQLIAPPKIESTEEATHARIRVLHELREVKSALLMSLRLYSLPDTYVQAQFGQAPDTVARISKEWSLDTQIDAYRQVTTARPAADPAFPAQILEIGSVPTHIGIPHKFILIRINEPLYTWSDQEYTSDSQPSAASSVPTMRRRSTKSGRHGRLLGARRSSDACSDIAEYGSGSDSSNDPDQAGPISRRYSHPDASSGPKQRASSESPTNIPEDPALDQLPPPAYPDLYSAHEPSAVTSPEASTIRPTRLSAGKSTSPPIKKSGKSTSLPTRKPTSPPSRTSPKSPSSSLLRKQLQLPNHVLSSIGLQRLLFNGLFQHPPHLTTVPSSPTDLRSAQAHADLDAFLDGLPLPSASSTTARSPDMAVLRYTSSQMHLELPVHDLPVEKCMHFTNKDIVMYIECSVDRRGKTVFEEVWRTWREVRARQKLFEPRAKAGEVYDPDSLGNGIRRARFVGIPEVLIGDFACAVVSVDVGVEVKELVGMHRAILERVKKVQEDMMIPGQPHVERETMGGLFAVQKGCEGAFVLVREDWRVKGVEVVGRAGRVATFEHARKGSVYEKEWESVGGVECKSPEDKTEIARWVVKRKGLAESIDWAINSSIFWNS